MYWTVPSTVYLRSTDVSSLKILQIIMTLDEEGVSIPLEKIAKIKSVSDIIAFAEVE